jgi:hypothetical protein
MVVTVAALVHGTQELEQEGCQDQMRQIPTPLNPSTAREESHRTLDPQQQTCAVF